jgi:predicted alpha/beta hydrolase
MPVYVPSQEEISDPVLYAKNVREVMARNLSVPIVNQTLEDGKHAAASRDNLHKVHHEDHHEVLEYEDLRYKYVDFTGNLTLV